MKIYNICLHDEWGGLFRCDCGGMRFAQVTDIEQGALGYEVFECRYCHACYRCNITGEIPVEELGVQR